MEYNKTINKNIENFCEETWEKAIEIYQYAKDPKNNCHPEDIELAKEILNLAEKIGMIM